MKPLFRIAMMLVKADAWAMTRGAALSVTVLVMGSALLGLSGWFITATGLAGLAGVGIAFDVFRPSAGVRFLALGRAAARYGERLLTHDATLRALASLRVVLLRGFARSDATALAQLRGEGALTRIISDVDALDGVILRLVLPATAAVVTHAMVFVALVWLVGMPVAFVVLAGNLLLSLLILVRLGRHSIAPSSVAEEAGQALRRGTIDMIRDREALILAAKLPSREASLLEVDNRARLAAGKLDRAERLAGFQSAILVAVVAMGALLAGARLLEAQVVGPANAVIGFFVVLALAEAVMPLRRGVCDLGRMVSATGRVLGNSKSGSEAGPAVMPSSKQLLAIDQPGLKVDLRPGEAIALTGPSGTGKSTLLLQIAGLMKSEGIHIKGSAPCDWPETAFRDVVSALPQRSSLIAGTIRDNLSLVGDFDDTEMWTALNSVDLTDDVVARGGLDARLGEGGAGLSGGQARRLCLARSILKKSEILLLDEPTEGLDARTADAVLAGIRRALPDAVIIAATHQRTDHPIFDRIVSLKA